MNISESCKVKHNTFDGITLYFVVYMDEEIVIEILNKLDDSMDEVVAQQKFKEWADMEDFLELQYESRLQSILRGKSSNIDDLKSEMKNIIVLRKKRLFNHLKQTYQKREI
jgi:hypothetical protein